MELQINDFQVPAPISFNYDQIVAELAKKTQEYSAMVYSEEQIREAKADRAQLNKLKTALNDERKRIEREYLEPFQDFKSKINYLIGLIDEPIEAIDSQIKAQENKAKEEKKAFLEKWFLTAEGKPEWLQFEQLFESRWLNATVKVPAIQDEINARIRLINQDLKTLSTMSFGFEATEVYKTSLNLNSAIAEGQRLEAIQKAKEEAERKAKEEEEKAKEPIEEPKAEPVSVPQTEEKKKLYAVMLCVEPSRVESTMKALDEMGVKAKFMTYDKDNKVWRL